MKDVTESDASSKKMLWRRKYQDVKVSSLLHSHSSQVQASSTVERDNQRLQMAVAESQNSQHYHQAMSSANGIDFSQSPSKNTNGLNGDGTNLNSNDSTSYIEVLSKNQTKLETSSFKFSHLFHRVNGEKQDLKSPELHKESIPNEKVTFKSRYETTVQECQDKTPDPFQRYLFVAPISKASSSEKNLKSDSLADGGDKESETCRRVELKSKPKARKARIERRHTCIGASSIVEIKDIQNWISTTNDRQKKDHTHSKDDSEVFIAKTGIVRTKLAENKASLNWNKKRENNKSSSKVEEGNFVMHRITNEKERNGSCSDHSSILTLKEFCSEKQEAHTRNGSSDCNVLDTGNVDPYRCSDDKRDTNILSAGINNRLSCFLTPRPFKANNSKRNIMQEPRSWNGDDLPNNTTPRRSSTPQYNGNGVRHNGTTEVLYIEDDEDFLIRSRMRHSPRGGDSKYNTFLDLSNLNLDEDLDQSPDGSLDSIVTSSQSDAESGIGREEVEEMENSRNESEDVNGIVSFILCRSLDKIEEEPKEEDEHNVERPMQVEAASCSSSQKHNSQGSRIVNEVEKYDVGQSEAVDEDGKASSSSSKPNNRNHNDISQEGVQAKKEVEVQKQIETASVCKDEKVSFNHSEPNTLDQNDVLQGTVRIKKEAEIQEVAINGGVEKSDQVDPSHTVNGTSTDAVTSGSFDGSETTSSFESDKFQSCTSDSNGDEGEFDLADERKMKTASLDRNAFFSAIGHTRIRSKRQSMPCDVKCLLKSQNIDSDQSGRSPDDKSVLRSGLKRLFQIAMSTVDGHNRPGAKMKDILDFIETKGIKLSDPRIKETIKMIESESNGAETPLDLDSFSRVCEPCFRFIRSIFLSQLTIPGFSVFKLRMSRIFENLQEVINNHNEAPPTADPHSSYNAIMRKLRPGKPNISLSVCTVDGQRCSFGNTETPHPLNACASVFNYCLVCQQNGIEAVSRFVGKKSHIEDLNEFSLAPSEKVSDPFSKAGSIVTSTLLFREVEVESRINLLHEFYRSLIGQESLCCDNLSYNYKRIYSHDEIGLAYFLSATQRLPKGTSSDMADILDFHFQGASSAMTSDACAVGAATLANGGVCCLTDKVVINASCVQNALEALKSSRPAMVSGGDKKAEDVAVAWSDHGSVMLVIPGVLGITCFAHCQSNELIRKIVDCLTEDLLSTFNFSVYKSLKDRRNAFFQR